MHCASRQCCLHGFDESKLAAAAASPAAPHAAPHSCMHCCICTTQAADIVRIMGIGRNEYIAVMVQARLGQVALCMQYLAWHANAVLQLQLQPCSSNVYAPDCPVHIFLSVSHLFA